MIYKHTILKQVIRKPEKEIKTAKTNKSNKIPE